MKIEKIVEEMKDEWLDIGWRYSEKSFEVGDELPNSFVWDGDIQTDEELPGTCVWETEERCKDYAKYSKGLGYIMLVGGTDVKCGEEPGERIFEEAKVFAIFKW